MMKLYLVIRGSTATTMPTSLLSVSHTGLPLHQGETESDDCMRPVYAMDEMIMLIPVSVITPVES